MNRLQPRIEFALVAFMYALASYIIWSVLEPWTGLETWLNVDNRNYHPDMIASAVDRLSNMEFPHWNPYQAAGVPFFSSLQGMVLYPTTWLALILPADTTHLFSKYIHLALSGFSIYFYLRVLKLNPLASFLGGLFSVTGNFYLAFTIGVTATYPLATAGILLGSVEKILASTSKPMDSTANRWSLLFIVILTLQVFAGYIQSVVFISYLLCLYIPFRIAQLHFTAERLDVVFLYVGRFAVIALLSVMLASIQILPTFEMSSYSGTHNLLKGMELSAVNISFLPSLSFLETLNDTVVPMTQTPWDIVFWILIAVGLVFSKQFRPIVIFYLVVTLAFLTLARGTDSWPYYYYYYYFPTGNWFRIPEKFLLMSNMTFSILVGIGLHQCHRWLSIRNQRFVGRAFWLYCFGIFAVAFLTRYSSAGVHIQLPDWHWTAFGKSYAPYRVSDLWTKTEHLVQHPAQFRMQPELSYPDADGALNYLKNNSENERILPLIVIDWFRIPDLPAKWATREKLYSIDDYEPLLPARYRSFERAMGAPQAFDRNVPANLKLMSLLSARWVLVSQKWIDRNPGKLPEGIVEVYADQKFRVYQFPRYIPRSYTSSDIVSISEENIFSYMSSQAFDPYFQVVVDDKATFEGAARKAPIQEAEIIDYQPEYVVIDLPDNVREGVLVLTDQYDPNWVATIDGKDTEVFPVNFLFRGISVSTGSKQVVFTYSPKYFHWGVVISLIAVVLIFGYFLITCYKRKRYE